MTNITTLKKHENPCYTHVHVESETVKQWKKKTASYEILRF